MTKPDKPPAAGANQKTPNAPKRDTKIYDHFTASGNKKGKNFTQVSTKTDEIPPAPVTNDKPKDTDEKGSPIPSKDLQEQFNNDPSVTDPYATQTPNFPLTLRPLLIPLPLHPRTPPSLQATPRRKRKRIFSPKEVSPSTRRTNAEDPPVPRPPHPHLSAAQTPNRQNCSRKDIAHTDTHPRQNKLPQKQTNPMSKIRLTPRPYPRAQPKRKTRIPPPLAARKHHRPLRQATRTRTHATTKKTTTTTT